ncbi:hypothetical protein EK21DRAFT_93315 [Setomelanomma holmii]|uniref:Cyanovirin-N domain-containing protein n=1 Tax=Setomelanomma holmii TaxID=210430 RepID=A0A9P4H0F6_9PLEO|nr:hypothetical protein EK21DRAFT_93315 [Setomelanomma holmii]
MPFIDTCHNISYDVNTGILSADCDTENKGVFNSHPRCWLNINDCLLVRDYKIIPTTGPRNFQSGSDHTLTVYKPEHGEKMEVNFYAPATIAYMLSHEQMIPQTRWEQLVREAKGEPIWDGNWGGRGNKVDLNDYIENHDGLLVFNLGNDVEEGWVWKKIEDFLAEFPNPNPRTPIVSTSADSSSRAQSWAKRSENHEEWLKKTFVKDGKRYLQGQRVEIKG